MKDDNFSQEKATGILLEFLRRFERGLEEEKLYLHRNKTINGKKKALTSEPKERHYSHVGHFNGLLNTAKNAKDKGFEFPKELSYFLFDYMWSQANGDEEWQIVTDLRKHDFDKMPIIEREKYEQAVIAFKNGHKDGCEEILNNPSATVKNNINDTQYKNAKHNSSDSYCGYKVAHERRKLKMKDFEEHLANTFGLSERMVRNKLKTYKLDLYINYYFQGLSLDKA